MLMTFQKFTFMHARTMPSANHLQKVDLKHQKNK